MPRQCNNLSIPLVQKIRQAKRKRSHVRFGTRGSFRERRVCLSRSPLRDNSARGCDHEPTHDFLNQSELNEAFYPRYGDHSAAKAAGYLE